MPVVKKYQRYCNDVLNDSLVNLDRMTSGHFLAIKATNYPVTQAVSHRNGSFLNISKPSMQYLQYQLRLYYASGE